MYSKNYIIKSLDLKIKYVVWPSVRFEGNKNFVKPILFIKSKSSDNRQRLITTGAFILKFETCNSIFFIKMCEYKGHDLVCTSHTDYSHFLLIYFCVYRL